MPDLYACVKMHERVKNGRKQIRLVKPVCVYKKRYERAKKTKKVMPNHKWISFKSGRLKIGDAIFGISFVRQAVAIVHPCTGMDGLSF